MTDINCISTKMNNTGYLAVYLGCMYAGKTSKLISIYNKNKTAGISTCVINYIEDTVKTYDLKVMEICYDAHNANIPVAELERNGYECVQIPQSCAKLDEPTRNFQDLVRVNQIVHDGNKLLSWSINNCEKDTNSFGEIKISKKSRFKRIDPAATCIFSHKRAMTYWSGVGSKEITDEYLDELWGGR